MFAHFAAVSPLGLAACVNGNNEYFKNFARPGSIPTDFYACYGYGCKYTTRVSLSDEEWRSVRAILEPA